MEESERREILKGLNEEQAAAVKCTEGPVLIVAGAGSGKTRVLTSRIAYILQGGCEASRVMALTFTKKAAGEMKERIALMVGERSARKLVMGTFHAVFVRFLREYAESIGYPKQFTIYDTSDSQSAIKACIKELGLDDKIYKPRDVLARISTAKNNLITVSGYKNNQNILINDAHAKKPRLCDLYELYQKKMRESGVMDFDDILLNMNILLRDNQEALKDIADRFSYIMVDEYQDTNSAQYLILKKLAQNHRNICVVGDDSQSIYAFRGAKIENILNFKKDYQDCKLFRLERNYRSTGNIVCAANSVIAKNEGRIPKECYSVGEKGEKLRIIRSYTEQEEAILIVSEILDRMRTDKAQYEDFAILYRTNSQSRALEEQLRRRNLPYMIYSGNSFFERAEVKDVMAWLKLAVNPNDDESFKRAVAKPSRGIGDTSISALNETARAHQCSLFKAAYMPDTEIYGLRSAALLKIRAFTDLVNGFAQLVRTTDAHELAVKIADESGIYNFYKSDTSIEGMARTSNVEELLNSVAAFIEERQEEVDPDLPQENLVFTLDDYLENTSLMSNADVSDEETNNKIALMTVHSAKGLEFPYVFVAGLEENLFPSVSMLTSRTEIEEERRLFYVAVTRAKKAVALSYSCSRMRNGKHESNSPSRFLKEIDSQYLENPLEEDECDEAGIEFTPKFGGFGSAGQKVGFGGGSSRFGQGGSRFGQPAGGYGRSSGVRYEPRGGSAHGSPSANPFGGPSGRPVPAAPKPAVVDPDFVPVPMTELFAGERIEHNRFGPGTILEITGTAPEMKARVNFDEYGEKLLLLKYAKMRPYGK